MRLYILFLIIVCNGISDASAQMRNLLAVDNSIVRSIKHTEIKGTPYLFDDWKAGDLVDSVGNVIQDLSIKYNVYYDRIEVLLDDNLYMLKPSAYHKFIIRYKDEQYKSHQMVFSNRYAGLGLNSNTYFEELYKGKFILLKHHNKLFTEVASTIYGTPNDQKSFQSNDKYYLIFNSKFQEIKLNKKNMINLFSSKHFDVERYLDEHDLKGKSEADWIQLLSAIDAQ